MGTLIVYASKYGFTEQCVADLASRLDGQVATYNLCNQYTLNFNDYHKVIIGAPFYMGKIHKEMSEFCQKNKNILLSKALGIFITGLQEGEALAKEIEENFPAEILNKAVIVKHFGGAVNFEEMNFIERIIIKKIAKISDNRKFYLESNLEEFAQVMNQI